jgi:hypothetical protein
MLTNLFKFNFIVAQHYDFHLNGSQHNATQHNDTPHNDTSQKVSP